MKKHKTAWIGLTVVITVAVGLAWMACRDIPNEDNDKVPVEISVDLEGVDEDSLQESGLKQVVMPAAEMQGGKFVQPPDQEAVHLKITITNPKEVFYVWNFNGKPVTITVANGENRVVDVEGYNIMTETISEIFPASHMISVNPVSERTIDLTGEAENVRVIVDYDLDTGYLYGGTIEGIEVGGSVLTLPRDYGCPNYLGVANMADKDWGLVFPSVLVELYYPEGGYVLEPVNRINPAAMGPMPSFYMDNVPLGKNIGIHLWHFTAEFYKDLSVYTGNTTTRTDPFVFQGFQPNVGMRFYDPRDMEGSDFPQPLTGPLQGLTVGYFYDIPIFAQGGFGTFVDGEITEEDTCEGSLSGGEMEMAPNAVNGGYLPGVAVYYLNSEDDCTIGVELLDCSGDTVSGTLQVDMNVICGDETCSSATEDAYNCYQDCGWCGDGICSGPETESTCFQDCGAGYDYPY